MKLPRASGVEKGTQPCWVLAGDLSGPEGFGQEGRGCPGASSWSHCATAGLRGASTPACVSSLSKARACQMWGGSSLHESCRHTAIDARPGVTGALPPALPKQPGQRGQELCALQPSGSAHKGAPRRPGSRCGRPQWRREVHPSSSWGPRVMVLATVLYTAVSIAGRPLGVGTVMPPSGSTGAG